MIHGEGLDVGESQDVVVELQTLDLLQNDVILVGVVDVLYH